MVDQATEGAVAIADAATTLPEGARIGRYRIEWILGRGGMGAVYAAEDTMLGRRIALKIVSLPASLEGSKATESKARLLREARAAASLEHPNVVAIYDVGEHEGAPFFAMELVAGDTLRARMQKPSSLEEKLAWLVEIAQALEAAHERGIVHRDVKPENVMLTRGGRVKVLDFGIARQAAIPIDPSAPTESSGPSLGTITSDGAIIGTPRYMAPEQLQGEKLDGRCDQFAWGIVAYELLAGRPPWEATDAVTLIASILGKEPPPLGDAAPGLPPAIVAVVERALSKSPQARFASMRELLQAIAATGSTGHTVPKKARARWPLFAGIGAVVALGAGLLGAPVFESEKRASIASAPPTGPAPSTSSAVVTLTDLPLPRSDSAEAVAEYRAGIQASRDGDSQSACAHFADARRRDPGMAAAYVRAWGCGTDAENADVFKRAMELRGTLNEHERLMLEAFAPCAQTSAQGDRWCITPFQELTRRFPNDAEFAVVLASRLESAGRMRDAAEAAARAIELDPKHAGARTLMSLAHWYLGDVDAALRDANACIASTRGVACLLTRGFLESYLGRCSDLETTGLAVIRISPTHTEGLEFLGSAEFSLGRPMGAVQDAIDRRVAGTVPAHREEERLFGEEEVARAKGDFVTALAKLDERVRMTRSSQDLQTHADLLCESVVMNWEIGRNDEAAKAAEALRDRRATLLGSTDTDDGALRQGCFGDMLRALRRGGRLSRAEMRELRDAWIAQWKPRVGPDFQPHIWINAYAVATDDAEDAREAIDALPQFGGLPMGRSLWMGDAIGRTFVLSDRVDEAIPWLEQGARTCRLPGSTEPIRSSYWLGRAREKKGDNAGACDAYAFVLKYWGNAKPKSVTADDARKRSKALGCASERSAR